MTLSGRQSSWTVLTAVVVGVVTVLAGCAQVGPVTQVTVPDVKSVTGTWKGLVYRSGVEADRITMTIREDGSYDIVSAQRPGTSAGRGKLVIADGRLVFEGERGRGVGTLLRNPGGDLVMNVDATLSDNSTLTAKLFPSNP
jgi:hypothetical protein